MTPTSRKKSLFQIIGKVTLVVTVVAAALFVLFFRPVQVPTGAMMNAILPGDHILSTRFPGAVHRGEIVMLCTGQK